MCIQLFYYFDQGISLEDIMPFFGKSMTFTDQTVIPLISIDNVSSINPLL